MRGVRKVTGVLVGAVPNNRVLPVLAFLLCLVSPGTDAQQRFQIHDLGTLGGSESAATDLDANNSVVGWSRNQEGRRHAFRVCYGCPMLDLGLLPGGTHSVASAISPDGRHIAGSADINSHGMMGRPVIQGFLRRHDALSPLGALFCPCTFNTRYGFSEARDVNERGEVVGFSETIRGRQTVHAFLWIDGVMSDIGEGPGSFESSRAFAINSLSQVVGSFTPPADPQREEQGQEPQAYLWHGGFRRELGTLQGHTGSSALSLNDRGQVVGWSGAEAAGIFEAVLWSEGRINGLGFLPGDQLSMATAINNQGQVIGWSASPEGSRRPFLWQEGLMHDLSQALPFREGWRLREVAAINDRGWIAGTAEIDGNFRAVLLEPLWPLSAPATLDLR
jgi:probable HAF family extracellular repeat protein